MFVVQHNTIKYAKPQHLRLEVPQRSLESIKQDFKRFQRLGQGKGKLASKFNNVCNLPIWDILLCSVCPPYLHILLGTTQKHHELLETECHKLDVKIAQTLAKQNIPTDKTKKFGKYVSQLCTLENLTKRKKEKEKK